ncbi:SDR family oxidoreductase [Candidatus Pacearchaeota archaeon]|nr:SDR family oxidoreductase [Candidatus Pacearchaeota archaeon]
MNLQNKTILITGSSSGIGAATALEFAKQKAKVIITYNKNKSSALSILKECQKHSECALMKLEITNEKLIKDCLKQTIKKFFHLDILINNAGILHDKNFEEQTPSELKEQIAVNLTGTILFTWHALPILKKQKEAMIINISSLAGKRGHDGFTAYSASKFGVRGFTQALACELPNNVRVYCVNPGLTSTPMTNFRGISTKIVAEKILETALEVLNKKSGEDIDLEEYSG